MSEESMEFDTAFNRAIYERRKEHEARFRDDSEDEWEDEDEDDVEEDEDQDTQRYIQKRKAMGGGGRDILDGEGCENPEDG